MTHRWRFVPARSGAPVLVIAHRGARAFAPENTLPAIDKAAHLAADLVELDVHSTRDEALVVVHDDELGRCSDARERFPGRTSYRVAEFTLDEIRRLDAGGWFVAELARAPRRRQPFLRSLGEDERRRFVTADDLATYRSGAVHIPTLREALERALAWRLAVVVEIKPDLQTAPAIARQVVELVADLDCEDQVIVSAFDPRQLVEVRRFSRRVATAVLTRERLADPVGVVRALEADAYHPAWASVVGRRPWQPWRQRPDRAAVESLRGAGIAVNVWTVNAPRRMRALADAGVSGLFTDYPNRARDALAGPGAAPDPARTSRN
jgi:glycerophosphoryl diester phosphodiesterase